LAAAGDHQFPLLLYPSEAQGSSRNPCSLEEHNLKNTDLKIIRINLISAANVSP
jgi:hypothetical protein